MAGCAPTRITDHGQSLVERTCGNFYLRKPKGWLATLASREGNKIYPLDEIKHILLPYTAGSAVL